MFQLIYLRMSGVVVNGATGNPAADDFSGRGVSLDPSLDGNFKLAKDWLNECELLHAKCPSSCDSILPTRLIDIRNAMTLSSCRLLCTSSGMMGKYAALSYCWGSANPVTLTTANSIEMQENIYLANLPKTIRDAIKVACSLDLDYLWVDALCIVQDSATDWQNESAKMGEVYSHAVVTIQATAAVDCQDGFLKRRTVSSLPPVELRYVSLRGKLGSVSVRSWPLAGMEETEPLHRRGWTLQEALLSPRILSYAARQMSWECATSYRGEGGNLVEESGLSTGLPKPTRRVLKTNSVPPTLTLEDPSIQHMLTWANVVSEYTSRSLTIASDKLPALSGLATFLFKIRSQDVYLAGLWRNEMPLSLLWATTSQVTRPSQWRAPSWSWAALDGRIDAVGSESQHGNLYCETIDANIIPAGIDGFGEVCGGSLSLDGPVKQGWRVLDERTVAGNAEVQFFYAEAYALLPSDNTFNLKLGLCQVDIFDLSQPMNEPVSNWFIRITETDGLMLVRRLDGNFERIGVFTLDAHQVEWFADCEKQVISIV